MMAADRDGQKQCAIDLCFHDPSRRPDRSAVAPISAPSAIEKRRTRIPDDPPFDLERSHAGIVHGGDAAADNRAAKPGCAR